MGRQVVGLTEEGERSKKRQSKVGRQELGNAGILPASPMLNRWYTLLQCESKSKL